MTYLGNSPGLSPSIVVSEHIATAGQTTFNASYYEYVQVYLNGMLLSASDYTANDGSTVVLAVGANAGDVVLINGYEVGLQGIKGDTGAQGLKGDKGDTGNVGPQGVKGDTGEVSNASLVATLAGYSETSHSHTKADVGLSNADNTSDASKPVSIAQATAIGLKADSLNPTITGLKETSVAMGANDINLATGNLFTKTITGATTLTISNVPTSGTAQSFILELTNGGSGTITWFSGAKFAKGTAPTLTASGKDIIGCYTLDGGTKWNVLVLGLDVK